MAATGRGPLAGLRVLEAGPFLPVPSTGANLARLGASVTRLEPPSGDPARSLYGGWLHELYGAEKDVVVLDLTTDTGRADLASRLDRFDVLVVGYRPAATVRLGLDERSVRADRPRLVHCAIVGYRSDGPDAERPGHDLSFLATSGMLGEPAGPSAIGEPPRRPAIPVADLAAGAVATQAILAALLARAESDEGCALEIAIADVALAWAAPRMGRAVAERFSPALDPANDIYRCADGRHVAIAAIELRFWSELCHVVAEIVELPDGAYSLTSADRVAQMAEWSNTLRDALGARTSGEWLDRLTAVGVPVDLVLTADDVVQRVGTDLARWRQIAVPLPAPQVTGS